MRPEWAKPEHFVFRGLIPRVQTFMKDLAAAEIPFKDAGGAGWTSTPSGKPLAPYWPPAGFLLGSQWS